VDAEVTDAEDIELRSFLEAVYRHFHYDFRSYSRASLKRRLSQATIKFGCESLTALQEKLEREPATFSALLQYLTVQVSDMFRDPSFFRALRTRIVPFLGTYPSIKIWIAGCSTGEEVYSLAILLREEGLLERTLMYATDINPEALRRAQEGVFALDRIPTFSDNHRKSGAKVSLSTYYRAAYGNAIFDRSLVERTVFSDHSLATDSVFAEVQLVSCRNVLIYFDRALQDRAIGLFEGALCRRGFLGLGARETLEFSARSASFQPFDFPNRWYQRW
jgi:chemotaxis protein methyltransferase CheR